MFLTASSRKKKQTESRLRELPWSSRRRWMAEFFSATVITSHSLFSLLDDCWYDVTLLLKMWGWAFNWLNLNPRMSTNTRLLLPPPPFFLVFIFLFRVSFHIHYPSFPYSSHYFLLLPVTFPLRLLLISLLFAPFFILQNTIHLLPLTLKFLYFLRLLLSTKHHLLCLTS